MATTKGIMGFLKLGGAGPMAGTALRVTSCGLKATQEITGMDTIDSIYDFTAYKVGPVRVEGDVVFPVPTKEDYLTKVLKTCAERNALTGQLVNKNIEVIAAYDHEIAYKYTGCSCNTMSFRIDAEDAVEVTMNMIGAHRVPGAALNLGLSPRVSPERMLTWNEISCTSGGNMAGGTQVPSFNQSINAAQVKTFNFEVNNNTTVFYGLNGLIYPDINNIQAGKREVSGSMEIAWNGSGLVQASQSYAYEVNAEDGPLYCTSDIWINLHVATQCGAAANQTDIKFWGIVYALEELSMTNDFLMATQAWKAYGDNDNSYRAISISAGGASFYL